MAIIYQPGSASENTGRRTGRRRQSVGHAALSAVTRLLRSARASSGLRTQNICERLEDRRLLSATVGPVVTNGEVVFYGTKNADRIEVSRNSEGLQFTMNSETYQVNEPVSKISIFGNAGDDYITVFDTAGQVVGAVTINGGGGHDKIFGGAGNDALFGLGGKDLLNGGPGDDAIDGKGGADRMIGGIGGDRLVGGPGRNVYNSGNHAGDTDDSGSSKGSIISPLAATPVNSTEDADPLAVFGNVTGLTPTQIRNQYAFGNLSDQNFTNRGAGQAIAVVIPYDVDLIYNSVNTFSAQFGLPEVNSSNLTIINASGTTPPADPDPFGGWEAEAALQLEWIHAIAPLAQLYLVLADSDLFTDLFTAVDTAVDTLVSRHGGGVVNMSFGSQTGELNPSLQAYLDQSFTRRAARTVTFVSGSGDASALSYPAVSPYVVGIGGTSLQRDIQGGITGVETGWSLSGGGIAGVGSYPTPGFQNGTTVNGQQVPRRASPDMAFNADPTSGLALFVANGFGDVDGDGTNDSGWLPGGAGGTSAATPLASGLIALANEQRASRQRGFIGQSFNDVIYDLNRVYPGGYFTDIVGGTSGGNAAVAGYDLVTGNGSPKASLLIDRLATAGLVPLSTSNIEWFGEFLEAINRTGPLASTGGGFIRGTGAIAGNNQLTLVLTPRPDLTPTPPSSPEATSPTNNNIASQNITVTNFTPVTLFRLEDNTVTGRASVTVSIFLEPLRAPAPNSGGGNTGGTVPPPPPLPTPIPGQGVVGVDESDPVTVPEIRTWDMGLLFTGKIHRNKNGREVIRGEFISPSRDGRWDPIQGDEPIFRGEFESK